jgi:hypothetical protein
MRRLRRECGNANRNVLGSVRVRRVVVDPFTATSDYDLARRNIERAFAGFHAQRAAEDERILVELRRLTRLAPTGGAFHAGDAHAVRLRVYAADEFFDDFWRIAVGFDAGWFFNKNGHFGKHSHV